MKRIAGLDIVRTLAILFVISVHFFLNTKFYSFTSTGNTMPILIGLRWLFYTCVPLFILLTGYLSRKKEPNKEYFKGIKKTLISYLFICIICIIVRKYYFNEERDLIYWIVSPFSFNANGYSWYIEMYIGLFLLAPYLNILYNSLNTKEKKKQLIAIFLILTSIPSIFNNYPLDIYPGIQTFPNWWLELYPITYYLIGMYIGEYKPKVSKKRLIFYAALILLIHTSCYYVLLDGAKFSKSIYGGYANILTVMLSITIFLIFYDIDIKNKTLRKIVELISICSLDMYLFSYLVDKKVYAIISPLAEKPRQLIIYMIPTIALVFTTCFIISLIKKIIFDYIEKSKKLQK